MKSNKSNITIKKNFIILIFPRLIFFISNRMISIEINEKLTSHKTHQFLIDSKRFIRVNHLMVEKRGNTFTYIEKVLDLRGFSHFLSSHQ